MVPLKLVYLLKMVIFHSFFVCLPEGTSRVSVTELHQKVGYGLVPGLGWKGELPMMRWLRNAQLIGGKHPIVYRVSKGFNQW